MHRRIVSNRVTAAGRGWLISRTSFRGWLERDRDDREVRMYIEMGVFG